MIVRPTRQPGLDRLGFMGRVVVHDDVDVEAVWNAGVDLLEEVQELSRPVALVTLADDETGSGGA